MRLRRHNSAVQIVFVLYEYVHGIDLPDEVFEDAVFMRLYYAALDLFILTNVSRSHFTSSKSIDIFVAYRTYIPTRWRRRKSWLETIS